MSKVVILGAGFSHAISPAMPLMAGLRTSLARELSLRESTFEPWGGDVEAWLAHISADQPWLSDAANARNRALFLEAIDSLYKVIIRAQAEADLERPSWLDRLAWQWSHEQATILTFNYDTLLEAALLRVGWTHQVEQLYAVPLGERRPVGSYGFTSNGQPNRPVPQVLKLHGSVNWWHGGLGAPNSEQLVFVARPDLTTQSDPAYSDLRPFLVPPTSVKNIYYGRSGLTTQWRAAAQALAAASEVDVIGYSFPETDLATRTLLSSTIPREATIRVVDPRALGVTRNALARTLPMHSPQIFKQKAEMYATTAAGRRISGWQAYVDDKQTYGLHVEIDGKLRMERLGKELPNQPLSDLLQARFGNAPYVQDGRRQSDPSIMTKELFYPHAVEDSGSGHDEDLRANMSNWYEVATRADSISSREHSSRMETDMAMPPVKSNLRASLSDLG